MARRAMNYRRCTDKLTYNTLEEAIDAQKGWIAMGYCGEAREAYHCPICGSYHHQKTAAQKAAARGCI